jgi:hypothetical protein
LNVLAVEVHQASATSSDLSFDLELIANTQPPVSNAKATLTIHAPTGGESFSAPARITISATAVDPKGYISHVEFFEGERRIGFSQIDFIRAPDPGTPIEHTLEWTNVPPGTYRLTARAKDTNGETIVFEACANRCPVAAGCRIRGPRSARAVFAGAETQSPTRREATEHNSNLRSRGHSTQWLESRGNQ